MNINASLRIRSELNGADLLEAVVLEVLEAKYVQDAYLRGASCLRVRQLPGVRGQQLIRTRNNPCEQTPVNGLGSRIAVVLGLKN